MTIFKTTLAVSALALGLSLSACGQSETASETAAAETPVIKSEATPVSAPADEPQSAQRHDDHKGHSDGYGSGTGSDPAAAPAIDHVFDFAPDDHLVGSDSAPNKMIVYASVTCGHCGGWFTDEYPILKKDYIDTGKVQMAFREIPTQPQQVSVIGFVIADCAPKDQYMDHIVHQMQTQEETFKALGEGKAEEVVDGWAKKAGLNTQEEVEACFNDPAHIARINRSGQRMTAAGMSGVPSIIINGEPFKEVDKSIANMAAKLGGSSE